MSQITTPRELFLHELGDILYVEQKLADEVLPKLIGEVTDEELRQGLEDHLEQTKGHVKNVKSVFAELGEEDQDALLKQIEGEGLEFEDVSATAFFGMLRANAIEGFFCDPIYGGNRDMVGWKLVGFPGARYDYRDYLDHNGARISIEPVGLSGRPAWSVE